MVRRTGVRALIIVVAWICVLPAAYVFLVFHLEGVDGRFRTYKRFYGDWQVGMSREQVMAAMERHYPADDPRKRPKTMDDTPAKLGFSMDPETSREPNCEGMCLTPESNCVTKVVYSSD